MAQFSVVPNPDVRFQVQYEDQDLMVVDKPAGVVTQPGKGHTRDSLLNGLFASHGPRLQNLGAARDWGLLHRLDRDTSGLVLVGLRAAAYDALRRAFGAQQIKKTYLAVVAGRPDPAQGTVQQPILEVIGTQKRATLSRGGQPAVTAYRVLATGPARSRERRWGGATAVSLIEARPATGRLHQIRVHLAHLGCPVLGDDTYGRDCPGPDVPRLCLHAAELSFVHPQTSRRLVVRAPLPHDLQALIRRLGLTT